MEINTEKEEILQAVGKDLDERIYCRLRQTITLNE